MGFSAVIVAAGIGARAGPGEAKQWRALAGRPVVRWSAEALLARRRRRAGGGGRATASRTARARRWPALPAGGWPLGGAARSDSVKAGLAALAAADDAIVLVHDAARPLVPARACRAAAGGAGADARGAILALPLADTLKRDDGDRAHRRRRRPRAGLWRAQTPQAFRLGALKAAYAAWPAGEEPTDEAIVLERAGRAVALVPGDPALAKLTYPEDFAMAELIAGAARTMRVGQGIDAHRFGPGDGVMLCGVKIAHDQALVGHSDADAGLHAITDALLGAIGEGDIGDHFPPTDPQVARRGVGPFLLHAAGLVGGARRAHRQRRRDAGLRAAEDQAAPRRRCARASPSCSGLDLAAVSVKATTMEGMGFTGREEGLLAQAVAMVELPA